MKVQFIKEYTDDRGRFFPEGKHTHLSQEFAEKVIKGKYAKPADGFSISEELISKMEEIGVEIK